MNKKASVFIWITAMAAIFLIAVLYSILTKPIKQIQLATNNTLNDTDYASSYNQVITVWKYWPLVFLFGIIIYAIIRSLKREPYTGYE